MPQERPHLAAHLGEDRLIERLRAFLDPFRRAGAEGLHDDAAVLAGDPSRQVVSVDACLDGVHFRRSWGEPRKVGHRAMARAASDVVAMGAVPSWSAVAWIVPPDTPVAELEELAMGMADAASTLGCPVRTADTSQGRSLGLVITVAGRLDGAPLTRDGASPGDRVVLTGAVGASRAAIAALDGNVEFAGILAGVPLEETPEMKAFARGAVNRFFFPPVRVRDGLALRKLGATAVIDVSDGVLRDAVRVARASRVRIVFDADAVPVHSSVMGANPLAMALQAGDDYVLLATIPAERVDELPDLIPDAHVVGRVVAASDDDLTPRVRVIDANGRDLDLGPGGFEHLL